MEQSVVAPSLPVPDHAAATLLQRMRRRGTVLVSVPRGNNQEPAWGIFEGPVKILQAGCAAEVPPQLQELEAWTGRGFYGAGFLAYELGNALDPALQATFAEGFPLFQIALFAQEPEMLELPEFRECPPLPPGVPEWTEEEYQRAFAMIRENILEGDLYQANLTFRIAFPAEVPAEELFLSLVTRHPAPYAAFLNFGERKIVSLSPELFLESDGQKILSSPMKGTARRLPESAADERQKQWLAHDEKNQAENLMITDMVRNDLGRICRPGTIEVHPLFQIQTYRSVHQMISTVHGVLLPDLTLFQILQATFPPASITGAPKICAVNRIAHVEKSPRKIYTGSIGCFLPGRKFRLNVAIRTLWFENGGITSGIGGGIVYDSTPADEWKEALLKSRFAAADDPDFRIFETILWRPRHGFSALRDHIRRAWSSQAYFGRPCPPQPTKKEWALLQEQMKAVPAYRFDGACLQILLHRNGSLEMKILPPRLPRWEKTKLRIMISSRRVNSSNVFLYHKTTHRNFFDECLRDARAKGFDELLFLNEKGEVTQGSISNLFLLQRGVWRTPAIACGLLPGIWRARMLRKLSAQETVISIPDLLNADEILLGNSVRGTGSVSEIILRPS